MSYQWIRTQTLQKIKLSPKLRGVIIPLLRQSIFTVVLCWLARLVLANYYFCRTNKSGEVPRLSNRRTTSPTLVIEKNEQLGKAMWR